MSYFKMRLSFTAQNCRRMSDKMWLELDVEYIIVVSTISTVSLVPTPMSQKNVKCKIQTKSSRYVK